jgi:hypothetical protein
MKVKRARIWAVVLSVAALATAAHAFPEIPKAGARALGVTRGKPFSSGLVFVNGKYLEPPYVVERWGTGIRINSIPVTGQVIDWTEFMKTQDSVKVSRTEAPEPAPAAAQESSEDDYESSLDDLFDDDPKPKKKKRQPAFGSQSKPKPAVNYSLSGEFAANDASRALLRRINSVRTEIDRTLRSGGFICFGDSYLRVTGDAGTADKLLQRLPELLRDAAGEQRFISSIRAAGMVYFTDELCRDLYRNRLDYLKLQERRVQWKKDKEWEKFLRESGSPLL